MKTFKKISALLLVMALFTTLFSVNTSAQETSMDSGQIQIGRIYRIKNVNSGKYLTVEKDGYYYTAVQYSKQSSADQLFKVLINEMSGLYMLSPLSLGDGYVMDSFTNVMPGGSNLTHPVSFKSVYTGSLVPLGSTQAWNITLSDHNTFYIREWFNAAGGSPYCLSTSGLSNGTDVFAAAETGNANQQWIFEEI